MDGLTGDPGSLVGCEVDAAEADVFRRAGTTDGDLLGPEPFLRDFGALKVARVVYRGLLTGRFTLNVRRGKYDVAEGVVCKGGSGSDLWMVKIKTYAYLERLKRAFGERWEEFWE